MSRKQGFTLMEMLIVLIIIGVVAALVFPNFYTPTERAKALTAWNNLLAIYSGEQNYRNNKSAFYLSSVPSDLSGINTALSLNTQDDAAYIYHCGSDATGFACTAARNDGSSPVDLTITVKNSAIQINGDHNPSCAGIHAVDWCP